MEYFDLYVEDFRQVKRLSVVSTNEIAVKSYDNTLINSIVLFVKNLDEEEVLFSKNDIRSCEYSIKFSDVFGNFNTASELYIIVDSYKFYPLKCVVVYRNYYNPAIPCLEVQKNYKNKKKFICFTEYSDIYLINNQLVSQ